jgi:hypothetical protein
LLCTALLIGRRFGERQVPLLAEALMSDMCRFSFQLTLCLAGVNMNSVHIETQSGMLPAVLKERGCYETES